MIEVRLPVARISPVIPRLGADLGNDRRVQRIGRQWHENLVAFVDERVEHEIDRLGRAGRDEDAISRDRDALRRVVRGDGLTCAGAIPGDGRYPLWPSRIARSAASIRCAGVWKPNATGSPILR